MRRFIIRECLFEIHDAPPIENPNIANDPDAPMMERITMPITPIAIGARTPIKENREIGTCDRRTNRWTPTQPGTPFNHQAIHDAQIDPSNHILIVE